MSNVKDILKTKGNAIFSASPRDTVLKTLKFMSEKNVGALLVLEEERIAGIFSERDYARHSAKGSVRPEDILVKDMMTTQILTVSSDATTDECMTIMTTRRIRHLPVMEEGKLVGFISIGDVVNRIIEDHKFSINQLERYVTGEA